MSIALPLVDLTSAGVGTSGTVSFQNAGIGIGGADSNPAFMMNRPHINIMNDSKCTLYITFIQEGHSDHLQPGAWRMYDLTPGEGGFNWLVESVMNVSAPLSQLSCTYYFPNENVDYVGTLGNSPIGGGVSTSSVQTLSNEGGPRGTLVIDIGDLALANLIQFFTDSFLMKVDQSGVAHQVLKSQTSGNPLQIGQAGDITEVLGQLLVDQLLTDSAAATALSVTNNATIGGTLAVTGEITATADLKTNTLRDNNTGASVASFAVPTSVAGTSGQFTPTYIIWGPYLKILHIGFVGYINNVTKLITFPSTFARGKFQCGSLGDSTNTIQPRLAGVGVQCEVIKTLASGTAGGLTDLTNNIFRFAHGNIISSIDSLIIGTTVAAANGGFTLIGA